MCLYTAGVQDAGEPGIAGVDVILYNEDNEFIGTATTDENGYYLFEDVYPDTYYLVFVDPDEYETTVADNTADNNDSDVTNFIFTMEGSTTDLFTIEFGQEDDLTFDAGYYKCIPVGELIWYDFYENNVKDDNENGINGVPVVIYKLENGVWEAYEETTTDGNPDPSLPSADGYWKFCVPPGTYYVEIEYPEILGSVTVVPNANGYQSLTSANESTIDSDLSGNFGRNTTESFTVQSCDIMCNIGGGFYPEATLGNLVWHDENSNGMQDVNEARMANVKVEAYTTDNVKYEETVTNDQGIYKIENLRMEGYYLKFYPPSGYGATIENNSDDNMNSDIDNTNGLNTTKVFNMKPGDNMTNVDAGLLSGVLPVEWLSVEAVNQNDHNEVTWATATEYNSDRFDVERRHETEVDFYTIGKVNAAGNSKAINEYQFDDYDFESGLVYYRIKQIDIDGQFEYSEIVSVRTSIGKNVVTVSPNPAVISSWLNISLVSGNDATVQIFDASGRLVRSHSLISANGATIDNRLKIDNLLEGVYNIKVLQDSYSITKKLIVLK